jgi:HD-like signal output (HDOD) protein
MSMKRIGDIIASDLGMSAKVLQLVNSSFFGLFTRVASPAQAVNLLGAETVKALVLHVHIFSQYNAPAIIFPCPGWPGTASRWACWPAAWP